MEYVKHVNWSSTEEHGRIAVYYNDYSKRLIVKQLSGKALPACDFISLLIATLPEGWVDEIGIDSLGAWVKESMRSVVHILDNSFYRLCVRHNQ